ncbi:hypothetical protein KQR57_15135 [Bacillus inaquosorum]|nr:hypothetical protein [Bacillus inaquosorum]
MNLEHPIITEINRYGYPKEYLQYDRDREEDADEEVNKKAHTAMWTKNKQATSF